MKAVCISASNIIGSGENSVSYKISMMVKEILDRDKISCEIIDLKDYNLTPCIGCGACFESKRCSMNKDFNVIYEKVKNAEYLFFISPHYAPIPAKLCMLLEKMEQITFLHWWKDESYKSELYGIKTGIISHGGGADWALDSYKTMVNDTITNALVTIQCKVIPYNEKWNTGIALGVDHVEQDEKVFPVQKYDWEKMHVLVEEYVGLVCQE